MRVQRGRARAAAAEKCLNDTKIRVGFEKTRGESGPQGVHGHALKDGAILIG